MRSTWPEQLSQVSPVKFLDKQSADDEFLYIGLV